jgi:phosphoglycolate phosphatase
MVPNGHEEDYCRVVQDVTTRMLPHTGIEIIRPLQLDRPPQHVLFDFDGTLSLIREGWPEVMIPLMVETLQATGTDESPAALHELCSDFVTALTGKQTIYQMIRLAEEVTRRGARPKDPMVYKQQYLDRLGERITDRR